MATSVAPIQHKIASETKMVNYSLQTSPLQTTAPSKNCKDLLDCLISRYEGWGMFEPWTVFEITPEEIQRVWSVLQKDESFYGYVLDKIRLVNKPGRVLQRYSTKKIFMNNRFDWTPSISQFIVRMPTGVHEMFTESVVDEIKS